MKRDNTKMPDSVHEVYDWIEDEVSWLHERWKNYRQLFDRGEQRANLLEATALGFFLLCKETFGHSVILTLSRLADPNKTCGKKNLSLFTLIGEVESAGDKELAERMKKGWEKAKSGFEPLRTFRHKRLAHNDRKKNLSAIEEVFPAIRKSQIDKCIAAVDKILGLVPEYYDRCQAGYDLVGAISSEDADWLVLQLEDLRAIDRKRKVPKYSQT